LAAGALSGQGAVDDSPLYETLKKAIKDFLDGYKRRVTMGSINVETGEFETFSQKDTEFEDLPHAAVSSASVPYIFENHNFPERGTYKDGGVERCVMIEEAV
jgi:predicted acylesterase/phospholipase RssA